MPLEIIALLTFLSESEFLVDSTESRTAFNHQLVEFIPVRKRNISLTLCDTAYVADIVLFSVCALVACRQHQSIACYIIFKDLLYADRYDRLESVTLSVDLKCLLVLCKTDHICAQYQKSCTRNEQYEHNDPVSYIISVIILKYAVQYIC